MKNYLLILFCVLATQFSAQTVPNYEFDKIKSNISMPVRIPLQEISNMVNGSVKDLIFEDNSYTDNDNDQFKVKVWKTRPIRLVGGTQQNILIEVPLKIWAEKGIGKFGVYTYQNTTFETVMYFNTTLSPKNNWIIETQTKPNGFKWVTKPVLDYGKVQIPITSLVETSLKEQQAKFCATIDQQMATQLNFQPYALLAWNLFSKPFNVSPEYNTWLKISPVSVSLSPLKMYSNAIDTVIGVDAYCETFTGQIPKDTPTATTVPNLNFVNAQNDKFLLQTTANIPYSEATALAEKMFLDKTFDFREGKSHITITSIKVYKSDDRVMIEAGTDGFVKGTSFISGVPFYDESKRKIVLKETKFKLKTNNILQKMGASLFQGKIVKMIEEEYGIPMQELEDSSRKSIEETFNKDYYKGLIMKGKVYNLKPSKIVVSDLGITAIIDINANLQLRIQGM